MTAYALTNALAMAIAGKDRIAIEEGDQDEALQVLADKARFAARDALRMWERAHAARHGDLEGANIREPSLVLRYARARAANG